MTSDMQLLVHVCVNATLLHTQPIEWPQIQPQIQPSLDLRSQLTRVWRQCPNENEKNNLFYTCSMFWAPAPHPLLCRDKGRGDWLVHTAVQPLAYSTVSCWAREAEISSCLPVTLCELGGTGHIATSVLRTNRSQTTPTKRCHVEISVLNRHVLNWTDEWLNAIVISLKL